MDNFKLEIGEEGYYVVYVPAQGLNLWYNLPFATVEECKQCCDAINTYNSLIDIENKFTPHRYYYLTLPQIVNWQATLENEYKIVFYEDEYVLNHILNNCNNSNLNKDIIYKVGIQGKVNE